jgi:hypothetical protein
MNGAVANTDIARPRCSGGKRSATTPPEFVRGEDPKVPDKNLKTKREAIERHPADPPTNATTSE